MESKNISNENRKFDSNFKSSVNEEFKEHVIPNHYMYANITPIDVIEADFPIEQYLGFSKGLILKYLMRAEHKNGLEDYIKIQYYLEKLIQFISDNREKYETYRKGLKE